MKAPFSVDKDRLLRGDEFSTASVDSALDVCDVALWRYWPATGQIEFSNNIARIAHFAQVPASLDELLALLPPARREIVRVRFAESEASRGRFTSSLKFKASHGLYLVGGWEADSGTLTGLLTQTRLMHRARGDYKQDGLLASLLGQRGAPPVAVKSLRGHYLLANWEYCRLLAPAEKMLEGCSDPQFMPAALANGFAEVERRVMQSQSAQTQEILLPPGAPEPHCFQWTCFPLLDEDEQIYALGHLLTDISHIQKQQVIDAQRNELRLLLDHIQDVILYLDRWGRVKNCNQAARRFFGDHSLPGMTLVEVFRDCPQAPELQREVMQVVRTRLPDLAVEQAFQIAGQGFWFELDKIPTIDGDGGQADGVMLVMRDITREKHIQRELQDSEQRYRAFISNSMDGIWCCRIDPPIDTQLPVEQQVELLGERALFSECNQVMAELRDCAKPEQLLGVPMFDHGIEAHRLGMTSFVNSGYRLLEIPTFRDKNSGERLELSVSTLGILEQGKLVYVWGITRDVTERHRHLASLEFQANHDSLTQLPNRNHLYRELRRYFKEKPVSHPMALLLIDLNRFKDLNDTLGHVTGDKLLKQVGPRILDELSDIECFVARLGGDEFAVFLPAIRNEQQAVVIAHRVLEVIREPFSLDGFHSEISAAIGIALRTEQANDVSTMMRFADVAMYHAKSEYSSVAIYRPEIDPHSPKRFSLMNELRRAMREQELFLHFQPKIELSSGRLHGFEALLRWNHPVLGFVPPGEFIPMVEATDIIYTLTEWVLDKAMAQCSRWHAENFFVSVAVNLSARNLLDERLPRKLKQLLALHNLSACALELEITEGAIMQNPKQALLLLNQISELGIKLSIDDFGTGYSSLSYLKQLPVQALKIDFSFVRQMLEVRADEIIVNSTINLAHNLGLHVVAEGVEDQATLDRLIEMGCDQVQGYFLGRPMGPEAVPEWFEGVAWSVDQEESDAPG